MYKSCVTFYRKDKHCNIFSDYSTSGKKKYLPPINSYSPSRTQYNDYFHCLKSPKKTGKYKITLLLKPRRVQWTTTKTRETLVFYNACNMTGGLTAHQADGRWQLWVGLQRKGLQHLFQMMLQDLCLWLSLLNFFCANGDSCIFFSNRLKKPCLSHSFQTLRKVWAYV